VIDRFISGSGDLDCNNSAVLAPYPAAPNNYKTMGVPLQTIRIAALLALTATAGCAAPANNKEPVAWRMEREEHAARVRVFQCRDEVARGNRSDCKPEIADLAKVEAARRYTTYSDVGNIGAMHIE